MPSANGTCMLTALENEQLTRVGAETPMGDLQRRYRYRGAAAEELQLRPTKRVRLPILNHA